MGAEILHKLCTIAFLGIVQGPFKELNCTGSRIYECEIELDFGEPWAMFEQPPARNLPHTCQPSMIEIPRQVVNQLTIPALNLDKVKFSIAFSYNIDLPTPDSKVPFDNPIRIFIEPRAYDVLALLPASRCGGNVRFV